MPGRTELPSIPADSLLAAPVGLLPVLIFLFTLRFLDSYKLVSLRTVLAVIAAGVLAAVAAWFVNGRLFEVLVIDSVQPPTEN